MRALLLAAGPALGAENSVELVLGQSPVDGGIVTPDTGVHRFQTDATIAITAVPQQGYRFSHWLGDVTEPSASNTQIHMNNSKAVVAIYEPVAGRADQDGQWEEDYTAGGGALGASKVIPTRADFHMNGFSAPGGSARPKGTRPMSRPASVPAPVPEPATFILLGMGGMIFVRSAKHKKSH